MKKPTRAQIASDLSLWQEYVDTYGVMTADEFAGMPLGDKLAMMDEAFGPDDTLRNALPGIVADAMGDV